MRGQTYLYIGEGWLLTVQRAAGGELTDLRSLLESAPANLRDGTMPAAYTIMADVVDGYAKARCRCGDGTREARAAGLQRQRRRVAAGL